MGLGGSFLLDFREEVSVSWFSLWVYCPIYGFGVTTVLMMILPFQNNLWALFIFSMIICTVIEYVTATILEALFHTTWWDYHNWYSM